MAYSSAGFLAGITVTLAATLAVAQDFTPLETNESQNLFMEADIAIAAETTASTRQCAPQSCIVNKDVPPEDPNRKQCTFGEYTTPCTEQADTYFCDADGVLTGHYFCLVGGCPVSITYAPPTGTPPQGYECGRRYVVVREYVCNAAGETSGYYSFESVDGQGRRPLGFTRIDPPRAPVWPEACPAAGGPVFRPSRPFGKKVQWQHTQQDYRANQR